jgi:hypothetical protein
MRKKILLLLAHSIAEYDDARMLTDLGYDVFSIGSYVNPHEPADPKRPPLLTMSQHPDLEILVGDQMAAKAHLPDEVIEWADVIIAHHYVREWLAGQWPRIRHKRVVWRTCGQSDPWLEDTMAPLRRDGLTIVRYSPAEERHFKAAGHWAGEDALIRFGKYVDDYGPWAPAEANLDGESSRWVGNITQNMGGRGEHVGLTFYRQATLGLSAFPAGPGSEDLPGGVGELSPEGVNEYLSRAGAYLYTGTVPASYTLGLIEAMLSGTPVVSIGADAWLGPRDLFEAHQLAPYHFDDPKKARSCLRDLLADADLAENTGWAGALVARSLFDVEIVGPQWVDLLGRP